MARVRVVFAADLHGNLAHYQALRALCQVESAGALLLGGDLFPPAREAGLQVAFARQEFAAFVGDTGLPVYAIPGNDDWPAAVAAAESLSNCDWLGLAGVDLNGLALVGYPCVTPTPFRRKDFDRRDRLHDRSVLPPGAYLSDRDGVIRPAPPDHLDRLPSVEEDLAALRPAVWVMHGPPYGGALDVISSGLHVGSRALQARIEALQPVLTLHGHIHESPRMSGRWAERTGDSVSVNPGQGERLHAVVFDTGAPAQTLRHTIYGEFGAGGS